MERTDNKIAIELTEKELLEIVALLRSGQVTWEYYRLGGSIYFKEKIDLLEGKISEIDKKQETINKLKTEKLCPSRLGLQDIYIFECESEDGLPDCNGCREESVEKFFKEQQKE